MVFVGPVLELHNTIPLSHCLPILPKSKKKLDLAGTVKTCAGATALAGKVAESCNCINCADVLLLYPVTLKIAPALALTIADASYATLSSYFTFNGFILSPLR